MTERHVWQIACVGLVALVALASQPASVHAQDMALPRVVSRDSTAAGMQHLVGRRVTAIEITGHRATKQQVITREIHTKVGDSLGVELRYDVSRLENLGIFAEITVQGEEVGNDSVRVIFKLKEMPTWFPVISYSYTEENGVSIGAGISSVNLTGRDLSVSARAYTGGTDQQWARISWPWISGDHNSFDFYGAHIARQDVLRGFKELSQEFTPEVGTALSEHSWVRAKFSAFNMSSDTTGITLSANNEDQLIRLGGSIGWDTRDSWINPRQGWKNEVEVWRTGGFLGGDGDWWTGTFDVRTWQPLTARTKILISGLATIQSGTLGEQVPRYMNYNLGGANSVRGYAITDHEEQYSGKNQMIGTAEYSWAAIAPRRFDLWKISLKLGAEFAAFGDAGIAWSERGDLRLPRARGGIGAGLRLLVPGSEMVRLDWGWSPQGGLQFHFATGTKPVAQRNRVR